MDAVEAFQCDPGATPDDHTVIEEEDGNEITETSQPSILSGKIDEICKIQTGTVAQVRLPNSSILDAVDSLINMDATKTDAPMSYINADHFLDQMQDIGNLEVTDLPPIKREALVMLKQIAAKINLDVVTDIQFCA